MNANNVDAFKDKKALNGPDAPGEGIKQYCHISHNVWKNAVAFECYAGEELISITLAGVGAANFGDPETKVYMPNNLTEIKAVGWDGARKTVYKK